MSWAFWIASAPSASFNETGQPKGLSAATMARPQYAMPQRGSRLAISANAVLPRGQSKEWYSAMARWNWACAASVQDTTKRTSPSPSDPVGPSCAPTWSTGPRPRHRAMTVMARCFGVYRIGDLSLCKSGGLIQIPRRLSRIYYTLPGSQVLTKFCSGNDAVGTGHTPRTEPAVSWIYEARNHANLRGLDDSDDQRELSEGLVTRSRLSVHASLSQSDHDARQEGMALCSNPHHLALLAGREGLTNVFTN